MIIKCNKCEAARAASSSQQPRIGDKEFDYVFDRGCFHVMPIEKRPAYVREITRILDEHGLLFLKCFSTKERREEGYKFSEDEIKQIFEHDFSIESIKHTVYQGTLDPLLTNKAKEPYL